MPKQKWDGTGGVYSNAYDKYFWSYDEVDDFCYDENIVWGELKLVICEPVYAKGIPEDFYDEDLPDDFSLEEASPELFNMVGEFNRAIHDSKIILTWLPGEFAMENDADGTK
jgi:hypothetical protein